MGPVAWAGCVGARGDPETGWRAAIAVGAALRAGGPPSADRRRLLSILWARLDAVDRDALGPARGDDLSLLLLAADDQGVAVSGVGLGGLWALWGERVEAWVVAPHPLLGAPGIPTRRPGALTVEQAPTWLIATEADHPASLVGARRDAILVRCGVSA